ncbi:MAG: enoyl-CoA hydratase/isomerase family protein [Flavobacteriaceae bacterium]
MVVTLNRPEVRNALNTRMGIELRDLFVPLRFTPGDIRCIVITGAEDKAFCAGGDLKERKGMTDETWRLQHAIFEEGYYAVMECPVPVIAAVNGAAYAGGCELALCCDFIYAAENANFALTEVSLGIMPGGGGTQNLPRAIGQRRAMELILSAKPFTAAQAHDWGMVNELCPAGELMPRVLETARRICSNAPISVRQAKKSVRTGMQMDIQSALHFEVQAYERMITTEDRREGMLAFNEKRKPIYAGK